jgi:hypothetical protein
MLSELHSLNLKLSSKQYDEIVLLHLIVVTKLSNGWQHNYSTKTRQVGRANEQSMYSLLSMTGAKTVALLSDAKELVLHRYLLNFSLQFCGLISFSTF